jgi:hypothetical protein
MSEPELIHPLFFPRGVAAPSGQVGYVNNGFNNIEAIDLNTGKILWIYEEASIPILATDNWLFTQKILPEYPNSFQVIKLDTMGKGRQLWLSKLIIFPDWVRVNTPYHEDFRYQAYADDRDLFLAWSAQNHYRGGANPSESILQNSIREKRGLVRLDWQSGQVEMLPASDSKTIQLQAPSLEELFGAGWWIAGHNLAVLVWEESQGQQVLQLRTRPERSSSGADKIIELVRGQALVASITPDGKYILVYPDTPQILSSAPSQPWWVFEAETGHLRARLTYEAGTQEPVILNGKIYYIVESENSSMLRSILKCKDLTTNKIIWEHVLEGTSLQQPPYLRQ